MPSFEKNPRKMLKIHLIPPTLEKMVFNTISLELWRQPDIVSEFQHLFDDEFIFSWSRKDKWSNIRERVVEKMSRLSLPELLKEKAKEAIDIIGLRITLWLKKVISLLPRNNIPDYIPLISLNWNGGIDKKKTATSILKTLTDMDPYYLYCFACFNCLEDEIRSLWETLPVEEKRILLGVKRGHTRRYYVYDIVTYWSCYISQDFDLLSRKLGSRRRRSVNINDYFVQDSIWQCNVVGFKYFWEKLSEEEKRKNIVKYAIKFTELHVVFSFVVTDKLHGNLVGDSIDICHYLGSQMNEDQLKEMVEQDPHRTLHFWCWCEYWHEGFIFLDPLWNLISFSDYRLFLNTFVRNHLLSPSKYEFFVRKDRRIFRKLWENIPSNIKRGFFENVAEIEFILDSFIMTEDDENLQLIFDDATVEEKKEIINDSSSRDYLVSILKE